MVQIELGEMDRVQVQEGVKGTRSRGERVQGTEKDVTGTQERWRIHRKR